MITTEQADEALPQEPTKVITDPTKLKYLIIGPPKWGKTTFALGAPDTILFATEEGHAFHEAHKVIIDAWDRSFAERKEGPVTDDDGNVHMGMVEAAEYIAKSSRFNMVVIDTADMAAKMCLDFHYKKYGVSHAADAGEYGKGWDICLTQPFRQAIGMILKSGRGVMFITHSNFVERKVGNTKIGKWETTLPSQVQKFLHTQADVILHAKFGKHRKGQEERDRIISMDGSDEILAGSRIRKIRLPKKFIVDPDHPWDQWDGFFTDPELVEQAEKDYQHLVIEGKEKEQEAAVEQEAEPISAPETPASKPPQRRVKSV